MTAARKNLDKIALGVALGGLTLAVFVAAIGRLVDSDLRGIAFVLFATAQIAAIVLGSMSHDSPLGKVIAIASGLLLFASLATVV